MPTTTEQFTDTRTILRSLATLALLGMLYLFSIADRPGMHLLAAVGTGICAAVTVMLIGYLARAEARAVLNGR